MIRFKWSNSEFWNSTLTEFFSALDFWCIVNDVKEEIPPPSRERNEELKAMYG